MPGHRTSNGTSRGFTLKPSDEDQMSEDLAWSQSTPWRCGWEQNLPLGGSVSTQHGLLPRLGACPEAGAGPPTAELLPWCFHWEGTSLCKFPAKPVVIGDFKDSTRKYKRSRKSSVSRRWNKRMDNELWE